MAVDSQAVFLGRIRDLGLDPWENSITGQFASTLGDFAHSVAFTPGAADERVLVTDLFIPVFGGDGLHVKRAALRRLFFEAYAMSSADLARRTLHHDEEEKPFKMPPQERTYRKERLQRSVSGVSFIGQLEASNGIMDKYFQIVNYWDRKFN